MVPGRRYLGACTGDADVFSRCLNGDWLSNFKLGRCGLIYGPILNS